MMFDLAHLSAIEAVWIIASGLGLLFGWINLTQSIHDQREAVEVDNGLRAARLVVAGGYVFRNRIRVAIFVWWTLLGIGFGFFDLPDVPRLAGVLGLLVTAFGWTLIGAQETSERRVLAAIIAKTAAERVAALVSTNLEDQMTRTADNTERIAEYTDSLKEEPDG